MTTQEVIDAGAKHLHELNGFVFDVLSVSKPASTAAALNLAKIISKLSPLVGNLIEFNTVEFLNQKKEFLEHGKWVRQDPGFPDTVFQGNVSPTPGFEIKAWFPLATEITARFKDSQNHFTNDNTYVAMLAWLPEHLIFGRPQILSVCVVSAKSVAKARDLHYHNPPDYIVLEPENTTYRTSNLQQTNTSGHKFQGTPTQFTEAKQIMAEWGLDGAEYKPTPEYQAILRTLIAKYPYRLDTNFAKMDRIVHEKIEEFKTSVLKMQVHGLTVQQWGRILASEKDDLIVEALKNHLNKSNEL
jgi:hypothetical protein